MKLTKGALTMLLAQYRAIYKNAFIKGLASAALATAVLASGSASAANPAEDFPAAVEGVITVGADGVTIAGKAGSQPNAMGESKELKVQGDLKFDSTNGEITDYKITSTDKITIDAGKTVTVGAGSNNANIEAKAKEVIANGSIIVEKGSLKFDRSGDGVDVGTFTATNGSTITNKGTLEFKNYNVDLTGAGDNATQVSGALLTVGKDATVKVTEAQLANTKLLTGKLGISEGTLEVVADKDGLDLSALKFGDDNNKINVTTNGTLKSNKISIDGKALTGAGSLDVITDDLVIATHTTAAEQKASGVKSMTVSNSVTVKDAAVDGVQKAVIAEELTLKSDTADGNGTIALDSGATATKIDLKGKLLVTQGNWTADTNIDTQANSELAVNADTALTVKDLTVTDGKVTIEGALVAEKVAIANTKTVTLKGEKASLDLSKVSGDGQVVLNTTTQDVSDKTLQAVNLKVDESSTLKATGAQLADATQIKKLEINGKDAVTEVINKDTKELDDLTIKSDRFAASGITVTKGTLKGNKLSVNDDSADITLALNGAQTTDAKLEFNSYEFVNGGNTNATTLKKGTFISHGDITVKKGDGTKGELILDGTNAANLNLDGEGSLNVSKLTVNAGSAVNVINGKWTANGELDVKATGNVNVGGDTTTESSTLDLTNGTVANAGTLNVNAKGILDISSANLKSLASGGTFVLNGDNAQINVKDTAGDLADLEVSATDLGTIAKDATIVKGTLAGKNLKVTGATDSTAITLAGKLESKLSFDNMNFEADKATDVNTLSVTAKKANLNVSSGLSVAKGNTFGKLVLGDAADAKNAAVLNLGAVVKDGDSSTAANGVLNVSSLDLGAASELNVNSGFWQFADKANVTLKGDAKTQISLGKDAHISSEHGKLDVQSDKATLIGSENSSSIFEKLNVKEGVFNIVGTTLTINGVKDEVKPTEPNGNKASGPQAPAEKDITLTGSVSLEKNAILEIGNDALSDVVDLKGKYTPNGSTTEKTGITLNADFKNNKFKTDATSTLKLNFASDAKFDLDSLKNFKNSLGKDFKGFINAGDASFADANLKPQTDGTFKWSDVKDVAESKFTNNVLDKAVISIEKNDNAEGVMGSLGAFKTSNDKVVVKGSTVLKDTTTNGGFFVSKNVNGTLVAGDLETKKGADVSLMNGGSVGKVTLGDNSSLAVESNSTTNFESINGDKAGEVVFKGGKVTVAKDSTFNELSIEGSNVAMNGNIKAKEFSLDKGSQLAVGNIDIAGAVDPQDGHAVSTVLDGSQLTAKDVKVGDKTELFVGSSTVNADSLSSNGFVSVGNILNTADDVVNADRNNDKKGSQSANLFAKDVTKFTGTVNVASGVDKASMVVFAKSNQSESADAPFVAKHNANIGKNAVLGYGFDSQDALLSVLRTAKVLGANGGVDDKTAVFALNKQSVLEGHVVLGNDVTAVTPRAAGGSLSLNDGSGLILTDNAFGENKSAAAITTGTVTIDANSDAGAILVGNFSAQDKGLKVFNAQNMTGVAGFELRSANGLFITKLDENGATGTFEKNPDYNRSVTLYNASNPVANYIETITFMGKEDKKLAVMALKPVAPKEPGDTATEEDKANYEKLQAQYEKDLAQFNKEVLPHYQKQFDFVTELGNQLDGGKGFEQSARFAVYGGSVKAAELASKAGTDAIKAYTSGTANVATAQTATGSIFVVPTYKSSDSDSFNAEGVDFGSDIKLSGVALGADYMVAPNVKVGAMFNVGTGDADGKGVASGIETDLDYVGGGLFASYTQDALSITADLTYTQSSADMKATIADNKVSADVDTTVLSLGVQGAYKFDLDGSYATPYAGIRYSKYDIDDYTLSAKGMEYMTNSFDSMTVFSIPLGVELGTQMTAGSWTVEPSLDLGVTFNLGDTDLTHSARAVALVDGMNLTSEVLDDVVFGVKGALKANYNGLTLGLGLGYEVGSNADDLSVQATGIYTF